MITDVNAAPRIVFFDSDGQILDSDDGAVAFSLPDYGLQFALAPELVDTHEGAERYVDALRLLDQIDWRLPTCKELELLIDRSHTRPATWPELAKHTPTNDWYWSSTSHVVESGCFWYVYFGSGIVGFNLCYISGLVRAVRTI